MKVIYDNISKNYCYPISKKDISIIKKYFDPEIKEKITRLRFGCNMKTTQEGRTVKRGSVYEIKVNFCLNNMKSSLLSDETKYRNEITKFGGKFDSLTRTIEWTILDAKLYSCYILFHEIGHVIYCENFLDGKLTSKSSSKEEHWCDNYAKKMLKNVRLDFAKSSII